jgi:hypothetical protein
MSQTVITVENLSKRYIISHQLDKGEGLRHLLEQIIRSPRRWVSSQVKQQG